MLKIDFKKIERLYDLLIIVAYVNIIFMNEIDYRVFILNFILLTAILFKISVLTKLSNNKVKYSLIINILVLISFILMIAMNNLVVNIIGIFILIVLLFIVNTYKYNSFLTTINRIKITKFTSEKYNNFSLYNLFIYIFILSIPISFIFKIFLINVISIIFYIKLNDHEKKLRRYIFIIVSIIYSIFLIINNYYNITFIGFIGVLISSIPYALIDSNFEIVDDCN